MFRPLWVILRDMTIKGITFTLVDLKMWFTTICHKAFMKRHFIKAFVNCVMYTAHKHRVTSYFLLFM
jgi:hypothetical protein